MIPVPSHAMVFAAGLGTRMRPLTDDRPKALVEVAGRALIDHLLDRLGEAGVGKAVVNVHHFAERMRSHLAARTVPRIVISDETDQLLETGGGLVRALPLLGPGPIITLNADPLWADDKGRAFKSLAAAFEPDKMDALLLLARRSDAIGHDGAGDFFLGDEGRLTRRGTADTAPYYYAGSQILSLHTMEGRAEEKFSLNRVWDTSLALGRVYGLVLPERWLHVGDPASRDAAEIAFMQTAS